MNLKLSGFWEDSLASRCINVMCLGSYCIPPSLLLGCCWTLLLLLDCCCWNQYGCLQHASLALPIPFWRGLSPNRGCAWVCPLGLCLWQEECLQAIASQKESTRPPRATFCCNRLSWWQCFPFKTMEVCKGTRKLPQQSVSYAMSSKF